MPTTPLLPLPEGLEIVTIRATEQEVHIRVVSNRLSCACPRCSKPSCAIHSYYRRKPLELPCAGQVIRLELSVKKFFCQEKECTQKIFAERLPAFLEPSSRLTTRLRTIVQAIVGAFNAKAGARLGTQLGIQLSRTTFLRSLQQIKISPVGQVEHVGIDDFAWKRGKRYGTVIVDLDSHCIIDLLPDRETESVKKWLESHPEIEVVSRDRGGVYADGAAQGAPQAIQCADRWHLCKNLGDAVESYLKRQSLSIPAPPQPAPTGMRKDKPTYEQRRQERLSQAVFERKQEMVEKVRDLHQQGKSGHNIAAELSLARGTVRKYIQTEGPVRIAPKKRKPSLLDPYYEYVCQRWNEETPTALQLFEELQEKGFQGGISIVKDFVTRLRRGLPGLKQPPQSIQMRQAPSMLSARELRWLLAKREEDLTSDEKQCMAKLFESGQEVRLISRLLQSFLHMVRELKSDLLNGWLKEARESAIKEIVSFVNGIERDYEAVRAGLTHTWSHDHVA